DGGLVRTEIRENRLVLDVQDSERQRGLCCSRGFIRETYRLEGGSFREVGPRTRDSFRFRVYPTYAGGPDSVEPSSESNIAYINPAGVKRNLTTAREDSAPSLSFDRKSVVFVRNKNEVWIVSIDGLRERKVFSCVGDGARSCDLPQFSPEGD